MLFDYDNTDPMSILEYARKMIRKTFNDLLDEYNNPHINLTMSLKM